MIIYGSRGLTSTIEDVRFFCPQCGCQRSGALKAVRRYFTLYFIPTFPIGGNERYVECDTCGGAFEEEILSHSPSIGANEQNDRLLRVMVMAALADGNVDQGERRSIEQIFMEHAGYPIDSQSLEKEIQMARQAGVDLNQFVSSFAHELAPDAKGLVVKCAYYAMIGAGALQPGHKQQLSQLATTLAIPKPQFMDLLNHFRGKA